MKQLENNENVNILVLKTVFHKNKVLFTLDHQIVINTQTYFSEKIKQSIFFAVNLRFGFENIKNFKSFTCWLKEV